MDNGDNKSSMPAISRATMSRFPKYLKALRKLQGEGYRRVFSHEIAELVNIPPTTIRRDFTFLSYDDNLGRQGRGYQTDLLVDVLTKELGVNVDEPIILIGVGNMGQALLKYNKWHDTVGEIVCGFDINVDKEGMIYDVPVYSLNLLKEKMPENCKIAILAVSGNVQDTVDTLMDLGIKGFVDFTHEHFTVDEGIEVKTVDVISAIQELVVQINNKNNEE